MIGRVAFGYEDRTWTLKSAYNDIQENYINEMGFYPRRGVKRWQQDFHYTYRPSDSIIRSFQPHVIIDYLEDQQGNFDSKYVDYHFPISFQNGQWLEVGKNASVEVLRSSFRLNNGTVVVPAGIYDQPDWFVTGRLDQSRRIYPTATYRLGPFYNGYKHSYSGSSTFRLNYKFNASLNYTHNNISLPGPNGRFKTHLLTTRLNYSFSTAVFLNALVQYNSDARQWSSNIRFNIIHRPLSDFFLVYNERRNSTTGDLADRAIVAKLTYMLSR
jgi:hypothetical protein